MERLIESVVLGASFLVPLMALWAIFCLYTGREREHGSGSQFVFFAILGLISILTIRTVMIDDGGWLNHAASLSVMIIFGVMKRPVQSDLQFAN